MHSFQKVGILLAVFAFNAIGVANASAASTFTYSATGELAGKALEVQKVRTTGGTIECKQADITGVISSTNFTEQEMSVTYTECNAFGFPLDISKATYVFTANGRLHFKGSWKYTVTGGIFGECTITFGEQEVGAVTYSDNGSKLKVTPGPITGISYTSTGGICGSSGTNAEFSGATEIERVGGGAISWDA